MKISKLRVTQCGLRNVQQIKRMTKFVLGDGRFNEESLDAYFVANPTSYKSPIISIARFPDGELFIADGHHRIMAIKIAGREFLYEDEFQVKDWSYEEYKEINFEENWVTPFDPRTHFRYPDFLQFKNAVKEQLVISKEAATAYILAHKDEYMEKKRYEDIVSLGDDIGLI